MSARLLACFAFYSSELSFEFQEIGKIHVLKKKKKVNVLSCFLFC